VNWPLGLLRRTRSADALQRPLLEREELLALWHRVQAQRSQSPVHRREVRRGLAGEARAASLGRGLDYEDSRVYQPGDDLRFMNWRLSARTGDMHMKVFREERRPALLTLVDRRAAMRFGTRRQLKASMAARLAALTAFDALQIPLAVGGLVLETHPHWLAPRPGPTPAWELAHAAAAPCPPRSDHEPEARLSIALKLMLARLPQGSAIVLLSDFHDLTEADRHLLLQLGTGYQAHAVRILDPAEMELPQAGRIPLSAVAGPEVATVDTADTGLRRAYHDAVTQRLAEQEQWFRAAGIPLQTVFTDQDALTFWQRLQLARSTER
jgi:uncharacterized protein (DUF58 family)